MVDVPMTANGVGPAAAREMGVPETVIAWPGLSVWPSMTKFEEASAVYGFPAKVRISGFVGAGVGMRKTLPARVTGAPGWRVWPLIMKLEEASAVKSWEARVMTCGVGRAGM